MKELPTSNNCYPTSTHMRLIEPMEATPRMSAARLTVRRRHLLFANRGDMRTEKATELESVSGSATTSVFFSTITVSGCLMWKTWPLDSSTSSGSNGRTLSNSSASAFIPPIATANALNCKPIFSPPCHGENISKIAPSSHAATSTDKTARRRLCRTRRPDRERPCAPGVVFAGTAVNLCLGILYAWSVWKANLSAAPSIPAGSPMAGLNEGWIYLTDAQATWAYAICGLIFALFMIPGGRCRTARPARRRHARAACSWRRLHPGRADEELLGLDRSASACWAASAWGWATRPPRRPR